MNSHCIRKTVSTTTIVAALLHTISLATAADDLDAKFREVTVGLTREAVTALMGRPDADVESQTLTVPHSRLKWTSPAGRSFVVTLIYNRVVRTKSCTGVADC